MTPTDSTPSIILIAGHWLGGWAWDEVRALLPAERFRVAAPTLAGLDGDDPDRSRATLDDQLAGILDAIGHAGGSREHPVTLVAHSGANAPVTLALDRHPELVRRIIWVDSGPVAPGTAFAPDAPEDLAELPLPPFDALGAQASLAGLDANMLARFRARAVPEPEPVLRQSVDLSNDARLAVPTTLVCCSISSAQVRELADAGHPMFAEVARLAHLETVDLPTGHWPMWSRPGDLAAIIASAVS